MTPSSLTCCGTLQEHHEGRAIVVKVGAIGVEDHLLRLCANAVLISSAQIRVLIMIHCPRCQPSKDFGSLFEVDREPHSFARCKGNHNTTL